MSFTNLLSVKKFRFHDVSLRFTNFKPRGLTRRDLKIPHGFSHPTDTPDEYTHITARVAEKSELAAYEKAMNALEYLFGIWNFLLNKRRIKHFTIGGTVGSYKVISKIRFGPVGTLHMPENKSFSTQIWVADEGESFRSAVSFKTTDWERVTRETKWVRRKIQLSSYKDFFEETFVRYFRALDSRDAETAFLKLWSLLEHLTFTKEQDRHKDTIERCNFIFGDKKFNGAMLEHLRLNRNRLVHKAKSSVFYGNLVYETKRFVEALILFHVAMATEYNTKEEIGGLLASKQDVQLLNTQITDLQKKLKMANDTLHHTKKILGKDADTS